jgi:hypothetical protein
MVYEHWEEAAQNSKYQKAVGRTEFLDRNGKLVPAEIIIGKGMEPAVFYKGSGLIIDRVSARQVDRIRAWRPY